MLPTTIEVARNENQYMPLIRLSHPRVIIKQTKKNPIKTTDSPLKFCGSFYLIQ